VDVAKGWGPLVVKAFHPVEKWKTLERIMPKITLKTEATNGLPIETTRNVENMRDAQKLFQVHQKAIAQAFRVFPSFATQKFGRISAGKN
jgi:formaldehyde-activating enzyme involved in methanogenesis